MWKCVKMCEKKWKMSKKCPKTCDFVEISEILKMLKIQLLVSFKFPINGE